MNFEKIAPDKTVSHYRLLEKIGEGGMGIVFTAEDTRLRRRVAIKFLCPERNTRATRARFLREARAASVLSHHNIAAVHDYGKTADGRPFIVMELLRGRNLFDVLAEGGLPIERSIAVAASVLEALAEAHRHGIIHRDVKPSNIHLDERDHVKVLDFGLAKTMEDGKDAFGQALGADLPTQTLAGAVLGTPLYVSPEQATGAPVDHRADLFAVGAVLYECLAGRPAFAAPSVVEIFAQVISTAKLPPPSHFNPSVTPALDRVVLKALAKSPAKRYPSAEEFLADLRRVRVPAAGAPARHGLFGHGLGSLHKSLASGGHALRSSLQRGKSFVGSTSLAPASGRRPALFLLLCVVTLATGYVGLKNYMRQREPINSVAVLPFANETGEDGVEYVGDGLTDSLIGSLSGVSGLRVIARGSTARYRGGAPDTAAAAAALNVDAVLTGSIRHQGGLLEIAVELMDARSRRPVWNRRYMSPVSELLSLRQSFVRDVLAELRPDLSPSSTARSPSANPAAYDLYAKGRWFWNKMTADGSRQAVSYFQQAIDLDPDFALAYVGMAEVYMLNSWVPPHESHLRARAAVAKALELDPDLGEAHATLGFIKTHHERDWDGAEQEYRRAIELSPNSASAHQWYASHLLARGAAEEFLREINRAKELDPLSPLINANVGMYYVFKRDYDRALEEFKRVGALFPNFYVVNFYSGYAYTYKGAYPEAVAEYEKALELSKRHSLVLAALGYTHAVSGHEAEARAVLRELEEMQREKNVPPLRFAIVYAGLGDDEEALRRLEQSYEQQDIMLAQVNTMPFFERLRGDARYEDLLRRLGLKQ